LFEILILFLETNNYAPIKSYITSECQHDETAKDSIHITPP